MRFFTVNVALVMSLSSVHLASAVPVSYTLNLNPGTSAGGDVTDLAILESAGGQTNVDFPFSISGRGVSVLTHDVPFVPTSSLIIGLTEGVEKEQIVMFVNDDFAQTAAGVPFSQAFPNTRHSELIQRLTLAESGDQAELDWLTGTFFPGDGAAAAFDTAGSFTAMEFTSGNIIGGNIRTHGNWTVTDHEFLPEDDPNAHFDLATVAIAETATDAGPFDFEVTVQFETTCCDALLAIDKTVLNNSGAAWTDFHLELGHGLGDDFVRSADDDDLEFRTEPAPLDMSGAFPDVEITTEDLRFSGALPEGESATMWIALRVPRELADNKGSVATFTIRQHATLIPEPTTFALIGLGLAVCLAHGASRRCDTRRRRR